MTSCLNNCCYAGQDTDKISGSDKQASNKDTDILSWINSDKLVRHEPAPVKFTSLLKILQVTHGMCKQ